MENGLWDFVVWIEKYTWPQLKSTGPAKQMEVRDEKEKQNRIENNVMKNRLQGHYVVNVYLIIFGE